MGTFNHEMAEAGVIPRCRCQEHYVITVLGVVLFDMSLYLLCPDEAFSAYPTFIFEFLRMAVLMRFQVLLHLSAEISADSTYKYLTSMSVCMYYKIAFACEVSVTAFFRTYPCSQCTMYYLVHSQFAFKCKAFLTSVTCGLPVQIVGIQMSIMCVRATKSILTYRAKDWRVIASVMLMQFTPRW